MRARDPTRKEIIIDLTTIIIIIITQRRRRRRRVVRKIFIMIKPHFDVHAAVPYIITILLCVGFRRAKIK